MTRNFTYVVGAVINKLPKNKLMKNDFYSLLRDDKAPSESIILHLKLPKRGEMIFPHNFSRPLFMFIIFSNL